MGIYDRDYYRPQRPSFRLRLPRTIVGWLIAVNVVVYAIDAIFLRQPGQPGPGPLARLFALKGATLVDPLSWWQFVTYAFVHAVRPEHIFLNMFSLWLFGREIEGVYGPREFLRVYLYMAVAGGLVWAAVNSLPSGNVQASVIGASGAVAGLVILYALHFPRRTLLLFFVVPVPAWIAGVLMVVFDAYGAVASAGGQEGENRVAFIVHLAGATAAFAYYQLGWSFGRLVPRRLSWRWPRLRPRLRVHRPDDEPEPRDTPAVGPSLTDDPAIGDEVDRILEKISRHGKDSLTRQERRTLEDASRRYQKRRSRLGDG